MSSIDVLSRTQRIVVGYTQRIVVEDKVVNVVNTPNNVSVINAGPVGPPGIRGATALFISDDAPVDPPNSYLWLQTGLGDGSGFTLWFEKGV